MVSLLCLLPCYTFIRTSEQVVQKNTLSLERNVHSSREFRVKIFDSGPKAGFFSFHWKCHVTGAFSIRVHFLRLFSAATVWCSAAVWKHEKEDLYQRLQFFSCTNMTGCHVRSPLKSKKKALSCILYFLRSEKTHSFQLSTYCFTLKISCLLMLFVCHFVFKTKINIAFSICG